VCEDQAGTVWAVTQNGLLVRERASQWETVPTLPGNERNQVRCVADDNEGGIWIGASECGLFRVQGANVLNWRKTNGLRSDTIRSLLVASNHDLWIGLDNPNCVQRLRQGALETVQIKPRVRSIRALAQDADETVWIGTAEGQLFRVPRNSLTAESVEIQERLLSIRTLYAAPDGGLWIGYAGGGLGRLKEGRLTRITTMQGLNDNYISQITSDSMGWLWMAGNRGIFKAELSQLEEVADGTRNHLQSLAYGKVDGLPSLQGSFDYCPGTSRGRDGRLWIATRKGLAVIHPVHQPQSDPPAKVLVERVRVDGQTLALSDNQSPLRVRTQIAPFGLQNGAPPLVLSPAHRKIEIDFTALSFASPQNVNFRYHLEGYDEAWTEAGPLRTASYSQLPAGKYSFAVRASNSNGKWNETGAMLAFVVRPFMWQTSWFRTLAALAFTACVASSVRYASVRRFRMEMQQLQQTAALHKERARIARDIHDDLGANLTQISLLSELARQDSADPDRISRHVDKISATSREVIKSLDEIVWAVNPRNDTLAHFVDYTAQFSLDYLRLAGIRCRLDLPENIEPRAVATDVRHNLFLVVKEALHNIVKHAHATEVWLRIHCNNEVLRISVEDNGQGFAARTSASGSDGLENMQQRLRNIEGVCAVETQRNAGTKVTVELRWQSKRHAL
jgi:signal transduction histidine kinase/streptogramin lyase